MLLLEMTAVCLAYSSEASAGRFVRSTACLHHKEVNILINCFLRDYIGKVGIRKFLTASFD